MARSAPTTAKPAWRGRWSRCGPRGPTPTLVVYAGNLHTIRKGIDFHPGFAWMAMRMAAAGVSFVTLDARYRAGTAWVAFGNKPEDCGVHAMRGTEGEPGIHLEPSPDGNYDGWYDVGPITASPPAADPDPAAPASS